MASSTMKNSAHVNVGKKNLPTKHSSTELYPKCYSLYMAVRKTYQRYQPHTYFVVSTLCLAFSLMNNFNLSCLNKQFSKQKYSICKVPTQFLVEWIHIPTSNASNVYNNVLRQRMFCNKSQISV